MKISKLFHWLYATLMFLPIIFFVPSCLYYSFNEHATNTETTTINYKYQSNEVILADDLVVNNIYLLDDLFFDDYDANDISFTLYVIKINSFEFTNIDDSGNDDYLIYNYANNEYNYIELGFTFQNGDWSINFNLSNQQGYANQYFNGSYGQLHFYNMVFYCGSDGDLDTLIGYLSSNSSINDLPQYTDYNVIESVSVNTDDTITDKVNRAWSSIWDLPLFSWTKTSFVAAPFSYITSLFGVGSDNSLNYVFAYFVSISICWLVFDLIMYVPNLAHRWLDRSSLE